jgi:UTP--glucose-1-phosphate uridylyltransferase
MKAVITAAGKNHRHLPFQTMADEAGMPLSILSMQLRELRDSGIEKVGIIISPGDEALYREATADFGDFVACIPQETPRGYAYAILCAEGFIGDAPFLLSVADHLFVGAREASNCFKQLIDAAEELNASVSAVQSTPESEIRRFGTIGGERVEGRDDLVRVSEAVEKPTPTLAEQKLLVSGLRAGRYYSYFGIHILDPGIFSHLHAAIDTSKDPGQVTLTDAINRLLGETDVYALQVEGERFDLEASFGLLHGQLALALNGPAREQVLADLISLVGK